MRRGAVRQAKASDERIGPTPERRRQAEASFRRRAVPVEDGEGRVRLTMVWQSLDVLGRMYESGRISVGMRAAGDRFHDSFRKAGLDRLWAADPNRVPVQLVAGVPRLAHGDEVARLQVASALDALGGWQSPSGSCAFHVLGCEMSLRAWSLAQNFANGRIGHDVAGGILIAALGILDAHWGQRRPRPG